MKKNNFLIIFYFLMIPFSCQGMKQLNNFLRTQIAPLIYPNYPWNQSVSAKDFEGIKKHIDKLITQPDKKILIIWDIDCVLLDPILLHAIENQIKQKDSRFGEKLIIKMCASIGDDFLLPLMDKAMPSYIARLQEMSNLKVICLTDSTIGQASNTQLYEDFRIENLKSHGLDFANAFPKRNHILYDGTETDKEFCCSDHSKNSFLFKKGILFTNRFPKNRVLEIFLRDLEKTTRWKPDGIIFIDDLKQKNLDPMKNYLKNNNFLYKLIYDKRIYEKISYLKTSNEAKKKLRNEADEYIEKYFNNLSKRRPATVD